MFFCLLFWGFFGFFVCLLFVLWVFLFAFCFFVYLIFCFLFLFDFWFFFSFLVGGRGGLLFVFWGFFGFFSLFFFTISKNLLDLLKSPILNIKRTLNKNWATPAIDTEKVRGSILLYAKKIMLLECFVFMSNFH